jgi:hypothetical protein
MKRLTKPPNRLRGNWTSTRDGLPKLRERKKRQTDIEPNVKNVILVLKNGHYRFIYESDLIELNSSVDSEPKVPVGDYNLPCLVLPFISDDAEMELRKLHHKTFPNRNFNISFKCRDTIGSLIKPLNVRKEAVADEDTKKTGVVYKMTCNECDKLNIISTYIGETGRMLETRIKEHRRIIKDQNEYDKKILSSTQVQKHNFNHHPGSLGDWKVEILKVEKEIQIRKVQEATYIKKHNPTLNADSGLLIVI